MGAAQVSVYICCIRKMAESDGCFLFHLNQNFLWEFILVCSHCLIDLRNLQDTTQCKGRTRLHFHSEHITAKDMEYPIGEYYPI